MKKVKLKISNQLKEVLEKMDNKIAELLLSNLDKELLAKDHVDYLDISNSDSTKISYLTNERLVKLNEKELDLWSSYNYRYQSKPGAILGKVFKSDVLSNKKVEDFSNQFKSIINQDKYKLSIVSGKKIKTWYDGEYYSNRGGGSLHNSCMKHEDCQEYFDIYSKNNIQMLILTDSDELLVGRALLWTAKDSKTGEDVKVMDRIYTIEDSEFLYYFTDWAKQNGYIYRQHQNWYTSLFWIQNDEVVSKKLEFKLDKWGFEKYPYLDTFKFLNKEEGILYNYIPDNFYDIDSSILIAADGYESDKKTLILDEISSHFIHRSESVFLENENIWTNCANVVYSNILNRHILETDSKYIDSWDDYVYTVLERNPENIRKQIEELKDENKNRWKIEQFLYNGDDILDLFQ